MFQDEMIAVISLQDFEGSWTSSDQLIELTRIPQALTQPPEGIVSCLHPQNTSLTNIYPKKIKIGDFLRIHQKKFKDEKVLSSYHY